jgi:hypothetical protein
MAARTPLTQTCLIWGVGPPWEYIRDKEIARLLGEGSGRERHGRCHIRHQSCDARQLRPQTSTPTRHVLSARSCFWPQSCAASIFLTHHARPVSLQISGEPISRSSLRWSNRSDQLPHRNNEFRGLCISSHPILAHNHLSVPGGRDLGRIPRSPRLKIWG